MCIDPTSELCPLRFGIPVYNTFYFLWRSVLIKHTLFSDVFYVYFKVRL